MTMDFDAKAALPDPTAPITAPHHPPIPALVSAWAQQTPDQVAIRQDGRSWTYRELDGAARNLAVTLRKQRAAAEAVVAVTGERSFGLIASLLAVLRSGHVMLPLDATLPPARRQMMVSAADARCLIAVGPDAACPGIDGLDEGCIRVDPMSACAADGPAAAADALDGDVPQLTPEQPAYIFFTSGTTGAPKGVLGTHGGLSHFLCWQRDTFAVTPADRAAQLTNLSFDVVLRDIFLALSAGATLCLPPRGAPASPAQLLSWLDQERITILHIVPTVARSWLLAAPGAARLSRLRLACFAGEPLTGQLVTQWRRTISPTATIVNLYGPTETTLAKLYHVVGDDPADGVLPIGQALPQTQALILSGQKTLCDVGETGEIVLRTPFRTRGYINAPGEQSRRFSPNPFRADAADIVYYTGDLGRYRADGVIEILGRRDQQIKLHGVRIEPGEIEAALTRHPAIRQAVVTLCPAGPDDQRLAAYLVCDGPAPGAGDIRRFLSGTLPLAMLPAVFVHLAALPVTHSGKIDYQALPMPALAPDGGIEPPQDELEAQILALFERLFGKRPMQMTDDFFALGGSSLLALQLFAGIEALFGKNLPLATLFTASRPVDLARAIRAENWLAPWSSLVPIRAGGSRPPLFYMHAGGANLLIYRDLTFRLGDDQPVYGLQPRGLDGIVDPLRTVEDMAAHYLAQIAKVQPTGPYYLTGLSSGGTIALEMAQRLRAKGEDVAFLAMFDTTGPSGYQPLPLLRRAGSVLRWYGADRARRFRAILRSCVHAARRRDVASIRRIVLDYAGLTQPSLGPDMQRQSAKAQDVFGKRMTIYRAGRTAGLGKLVDDLLIFLLRHSSRPFFAGILAEGVAYPAIDGDSERLRWIQELSDHASRTYVPQPYGGKITYFQAIDSPPGVRPAPMGGWGQIAAGGLELYRIPGDHTSIMQAPELAQQLDACLARARAGER